MAEYIVPAGYGEAEYVDKKSRFIGQVQHSGSEAEAMAFVESVRKSTRTRPTMSGHMSSALARCAGQMTASRAAPRVSPR